MKIFKNHSDGFTFIEVMVAITIVGTMAVALMNLAGTIMQTSFRAHNIIKNIMVLNNFVVESKRSVLEPGKKIDRKIEEENKELKLEIQKPSEGAQLSKEKNIYIVNSSINWFEYLIKKTETIAYPIYIKSDSAKATTDKGKNEGKK